MRRVTIIDILRGQIKNGEEELIGELLIEVDEFLYHYDLFEGTKYNDIFYFIYLEEKYMTNQEIASIVDVEEKQIYIIKTNIEKYIELLIKTDKKYQKIREYLSQK